MTRKLICHYNEITLVIGQVNVSYSGKCSPNNVEHEMCVVGVLAMGLE